MSLEKAEMFGNLKDIFANLEAASLPDSPDGEVINKEELKDGAMDALAKLVGDIVD